MSEEQAPVKTEAPKQKRKIAAILIRGRIGLHRDVKYTLDLLKLQNKHVCVILKEDKATAGMLQKAKDAITWGTISESTYKELIEKRGQKGADGKTKPFFKLHPPRGGFERKGIKTPFGLGGALGNRKEKMDELIKKML